MRSLTILLAEDEPLISLHIRYIMEDMGIQVVEVIDETDICQACAMEKPFLVILNFRQANRSNGMTLARRIKELFKIPVMLISGAHSREIAAVRDYDPACEILHKPFTPAQLQGSVSKWL